MTEQEELLALATDLSNDKPGSRTRAVEMLRRLAAKPAEDVREMLENIPEEIGDNALWALASTLHSNVPEEKRPMSWSDFSPEQIERLHQATNAFLAALSTTQAPKP